MIGQEIGHYRVTSKPGAGGMGEVFLAADTRLERKAAITFLPIEMATDPERRQWFLKEARAASALNYPSVASLGGSRRFARPSRWATAMSYSCTIRDWADFRQLVANVMLGQMIAELEQVAARELPDADALLVASARAVAELLRSEASLLIRGSIQTLQPPAENFDAFNQGTRKPIDRTQ